MKASNHLAAEKLAGKIPEGLARELDIFANEVALRKTGKIDERVFAETRLRRGAYGQRYDNGQRSDGAKVQEMNYPSGSLTKGPMTMWDAPGMQRIKIPGGGLTVEQIETVADLAEEYSDGIAHVTTRQDFQLHYVHIEDTPTIMRRLGAVGITTREACGNSVRNITACPYAGVCRDEVFDVTPYSQAMFRFLLGHPDVQNFGRKFKPAFSGCSQNACALTNIHDIGFIAATRMENGEQKRGFVTVVGGGLGAVPYNAKLLDEFVPVDEILPITQAVSRVFARLGEKRNRSRARLKFLVQDLGIEKFRELVAEERKTLPYDPRWTELIKDAEKFHEEALRPGGELPKSDSPEFKRWLRTNLWLQKQGGYTVATVTLPLGDITANQLRALADVVRRYTKGTVRSTVEQNFVIRWVSLKDLPNLYRDLEAMGLGEAGAGAIVDIVTCPGTDTCKLGISSSRGLAGELRKRLTEKRYEFDQPVENLHIKISGCFNSCGQHHVADLGFYGVSRKMGGFAVPHFQVVLGGEWENNGGTYGLPILAIPSKRIPEVVTRLTEKYVANCQEKETFKEFAKRTGKVQLKTWLEDLAKPAAPGDRTLFSDWGDPREYTLGDMGTGECAGEVITSTEFELTAAEREVFEAQVALDNGKIDEASKTAYKAMLDGAKALVKIAHPMISDNPDQIISEFKSLYYDTQRFWDPFAGGKFAHYLFDAHQKANETYNEDASRYLIDEAQLFIDAAHSCYNQLGKTVTV
jgi:sulfite reductase (ferredoxin)